MSLPVLLPSWKPWLDGDGGLISRFGAPEDADNVKVPLALLPSKNEDMEIVRTSLRKRNELADLVDQQDLRRGRGQEQGKERVEALQHCSSWLDGCSR